MDINNIDEQIDNFKKLSLIEKEKIVLDRMIKLSATTKMYCDSIKTDNEVLVSRELLDVNGDEFSSDDFVEAIYTLLFSIENSIFTFHETNAKLLEDLLLTEISD